MSTKAGRFADEAEALGWTVERIRDGDARIVKTRRGEEQFNFAWESTDNGQLVMESGWHWIGANAEPANNVSAALRAMALPPALDLSTSTDTEVLDYVRGRRITWTNSISGLEEDAIVPAHGKQTAINTITRRVLNFAAEEGGFRSVALDAITRVK